MRNGRDPRRGEGPVRGVDDVADRQRVGDRQDDVLRALEQGVQRAGDPHRSLDPALASARALRIGLVRPGPGAIVLERAALERAETDLVQRGEDEALRRTRAESQLERLLRPHEPRRDPEVDLLVRERLAQREGLLRPLFRQPLSRRDRAHVVGDVRASVAVADEQQSSQKSTLR